MYKVRSALFFLFSKKLFSQFVISRLFGQYQKNNYGRDFRPIGTRTFSSSIETVFGLNNTKLYEFHTLFCIIRGCGHLIFYENSESELNMLKTRSSEYRYVRNRFKFDSRQNILFYKYIFLVEREKK